MAKQNEEVAEEIVSEEEWFAEKNRALDEIEARDAKREPRIVASEIFLKDLGRKYPEAAIRPKGGYDDFEVEPAVHLTKGDNASFVPIDGL